MQKGGGILITAGLLGGAIIGVIAGQATIGLIAGLVVGVAGALLIAALDARRRR